MAVGDGVSGKELLDPLRTPSTRPGVADPRTVSSFHQNADTDVSKDAAHHTLGPASNQAAAGNHNHDGVGTWVLHYLVQKLVMLHWQVYVLL